MNQRSTPGDAFCVAIGLDTGQPSGSQVVSIAVSIFSMSE